jgi:hypothetical protein
MSVFRLVLCLAGLAVYLLAKQTLPLTEVSEPMPLKAPDSGEVTATPLGTDGAGAVSSSPEPGSPPAGKHPAIPLIHPGVIGFKQSAD